jgi:hypothetical protein
MSPSLIDSLSLVARLDACDEFKNEKIDFFSTGFAVSSVAQLFLFVSWGLLYWKISNFTDSYYSKKNGLLVSFPSELLVPPRIKKAWYKYRTNQTLYKID